MAGFFQEFAKKLAERWATLLLVPGAILLAAVWAAAHLGQAHALDWDALARAAADSADALARQSVGTQALLLAAVLLAATAAGLAAQALAGITRRIWLGDWPFPLTPVRRWRAARRRARWHRRVDHRRGLENAYPRDTRTPTQQHCIDQAADRVNRLALAEPDAPTWMGDRMHAVAQIALDRYGLDLSFAWPRLWLVLPSTARDEITAAHGAFAAAVATGTWAWPYLLLGAWWWPAALAGLVIGATGWVRARAAVTDLNALTEAAVDLHARALAVALGISDPDAAGPLALHEGHQITALTRKGR